MYVRDTLTLGTRAFDWIRLTVPQEAGLRAQEMLEHLSACLILTMCWEAESEDSEKNSHFTGEMHGRENGTQILGAGPRSSHLNQSQT